MTDIIFEYERIPLEGVNPKIAYVYHRKGSSMYKLYYNSWNIAIYKDPYLFAVFPAYKMAHEWVLKAFMAQYIPGTPLSVNNFYPGCSKVYIEPQDNPVLLK